MKKNIFLICIAMLLLLSGCSIKVQRDTIYIPQGKVESVEIQRKYKGENGDLYFCKKEIKDSDQIERICDLVRELPAEKATSDQPNPIEDVSIIVILHSQKDHRLILNESMAFYDQVAYSYTEKGVCGNFLSLYDDLKYDEVKTEPSYY